MERSDLIRVSAVYALPARQVVIQVNVRSGATVADVVKASGLDRTFPGIDEAECAIYGRAVPRTEIVRAGDRVEILRPLLVDPKEGRRRAAATTRVKRS